jgi:hypothetical protein
MTYRLSVSILILMLLAYPSFEIIKALRFTSSLAMTAIRPVIVESIQSAVGNEGEEDDDDDVPIVPNPLSYLLQ